jgi:hypothetical protein
MIHMPRRQPKSFRAMTNLSVALINNCTTQVFRDLDVF